MRFLLGAIDDAHAYFAELGNDAVAADDLRSHSSPPDSHFATVKERQPYRTGR